VESSREPWRRPLTERDLEQRLRAHLHHRFDGAQPPPELVASVRQAISTPRLGMGRPSVRSLIDRPGWVAVAAVLLVAVVAIVGFQARIFAPGAQATPSPAAEPTTRHFIVLPSSITVPDKSQTSLAEAVLTTRLRALGFESFTSSAGIEIKYELPRTGPTDKAVEDTLRAAGDVAFVPLPRETYGDQNGGSGINLPIGQELPTDEAVLFGWEGIASVEIATDQQDRRVLQVTLKPAAAAAFGDYTTGHVGELFAILIDGEVAAVPGINEPVENGELQVAFGQQAGDPDVPMAILVGGKLPVEWTPPVVPHVRPAQDFVPQFQLGSPGATLLSAELGVYESTVGFPWVAVWRMTFAGDFEQCGDLDPLPSFCTPEGHLLVTVDVETGNSYP
jgi:hypothetical protein